MTQLMVGTDKNNLLREVRVDETGSIDVNVQDQTTTPLIFRLNEVIGETTLAEATSIGDKTVVVTSATGILAGQYLTILSEVTQRFFLAKIITVVGTTLTLDTPLDSEFPIGAGFVFRNSDMAVNGSVTPRYFSFRGDIETDIDAVIDITRIIISMTCDGVVAFPTFGDLTALTNGIVLRRKDGVYQNIFNVKSNSEIASIMHDLTIYAASNPQQGVDGLNAKLTFSGKEKMGVVIRIAKGEDLEVIVQDDLSALLKFEIVAEGHIVET